MSEDSLSDAEGDIGGNNRTVVWGNSRPGAGVGDSRIEPDIDRLDSGRDASGVAKDPAAPKAFGRKLVRGRVLKWKSRTGYQVSPLGCMRFIRCSLRQW